MMKKKNGFISISVVYSFFVVFMLLLIIIINSYVNNRASFDIYKDFVKDKMAAQYVVTGGNTEKLNDKIKNMTSSYGVTAWNSRNWYVQRVDNDYYFRGSTPPNFVCLSPNSKDNCQENTNGLYRIIGVFYATNNMTDDTKLRGKYLVKLVKYYPYKMVKHSEIMYELGQYLDFGEDAFGNKLFDDKLKPLIVPIKQTVYKRDSASVTFSDMRSRENSSRDTSASYASLLTVSDIGYTTGDFTSPSTINCRPMAINADNLSGQYNGHHTGCQAYGWNISPQWLYNNNASDQGFKINDDGNIVIDPTDSELIIRPVIYLDPDAIILKGTGSQDNPYMLNIYEGEDTSE